MCIWNWTLKIGEISKKSKSVRTMTQRSQHCLFLHAAFLYRQRPPPSSSHATFDRWVHAFVIMYCMCSTKCHMFLVQHWSRKKMQVGWRKGSKYTDPYSGGLTQVQEQVRNKFSRNAGRREENISQRLAWRSLIKGALVLKIIAVESSSLISEAEHVSLKCHQRTTHI